MFSPFLVTVTSSFYNIPSATIETPLRPRSPITVPTIHDNNNDCASSTQSPPVSTWSPDVSHEDDDDMDELYIRRVFSFDEWEYNHPQYESTSPLHREPLGPSDLNRYHDSLKTLAPSLFQEIWNKKLHDERNTSIPSPESAFCQFQKKQDLTIDTTTCWLPNTTTTATTPLPFMAPWCPSIPRESSSSEGSFVCIDLNESKTIPHHSHHSSIPEYVLVVSQDSNMEEEEEEVEL